VTLNPPLSLKALYRPAHLTGADAALFKLSAGREEETILLAAVPHLLDYEEVVQLALGQIT
jgi:hypothetical protein